ncbi:MAG TPA: hypothetical protein PLT09_04215 [Deltaproteobacteria bacterium]|nr:hypothetical protein [Deltaproteobacteria bacterium]HPR54511.1 hypothetical protein [Deltaproteobacteria bacterium]HXK46619.1 hypothetical protein [Deltaproteobacteria bacterium]
MMKDILYEKVEQRLIEKELDPKKSTMLAQWTCADHQGSFRNDTETLYMSGKGEYFIVYEGGLNAGFHELPGVESWFGGSYTRSLPVEDAFVWCEETGNYDAILEHVPFFLMSMERRKKDGDSTG